MPQIHEIMSTDVEVISPDASIKQAAQQMRDGDFGFLPVGDNDQMVGMITDRDIAIRAVADGQDPSTSVSEVMTPETYYCFEDQDVEEVCDNMADIKVRRLPVVNRDKRLVGVVSFGDVSQACDRSKTGDAMQEITAGCMQHAKAA